MACWRKSCYHHYVGRHFWTTSRVWVKSWLKLQVAFGIAPKVQQCNYFFYHHWMQDPSIYQCNIQAIGEKIEVPFLDLIPMQPYHFRTQCYCDWRFTMVSRVPNLSLTMNPFNISTDEHVPLQHFDRCRCTLKISYDKIFYHDSWLITDIFNNKHITGFENNIHWYMHKYLEINGM